MDNDPNVIVKTMVKRARFMWCMRKNTSTFLVTILAKKSI
jgi:hypothetical protein